MILECRNVSKSYTRNQDKLPILEDINFCIYEGDSLSIVGPSGSGKTTLLALCAGLDDPTTGEVYFDGHVLAQLNERERSRIRNQRIGFIFQSFHLIPSLTALENVMVPMEIAGAIDVATRAMEWLDRVGLAERSTHLPSQMSGGEQQRVCLARTLATAPEALLVDEGTSALDERATRTLELLVSGLAHRGTPVLWVTHDLAQANRIADHRRTMGDQR